MKHSGLAVALAVALATGGALAADRYTYKFTPGKALKYRTILLSEGSFVLPDGSPKSMKLEAVSVVQLTPQAAAQPGASGGTAIVTETLHTRTMMEGREVAAPKAGEKKTITVRPDGTIVSGDQQTFAIIFPERPLARGDSFVEERKTPAGGPGLPLRTTYTVADQAASAPGYAGPVTVIEAKSELAGKPAGRKLTLKEGGGKLWFDPVAGVLVKAHLSYAFSEETPLPGATGNSTRLTTVHYESELLAK